MFPDLAAAVDELSVPADPRALRALLVLRDRLDAKVAQAIGEFDHLALWDLTGATSMKMWLRDEGFAGPDAHRMATIGRRMRELPAVARAWEAGDLSNGQVRAIVANLVDRHITKFQEIEEIIVPTMVGLSVDDTNRVMAEWRARADALDDSPPSDPEETLHHSRTLDNRFVTNGSFDADGGNVIAAALEVADDGSRDVTHAVRSARALVTVCRFFLAHHAENLTPRRRPHVALVIDAEKLDGTAEDAHSGAVIGAEAISRYLCDCSISRVVAERLGTQVSRVLDLGQATPVVSAAQRAALAVRDRHCRWPSCDRPASWCDGHHVRWVTRGGPTDLDNLVLLCDRHHALAHQEKRGFKVEIDTDATLHVTYPGGTTRTTRPPGALPFAA